MAVINWDTQLLAPLQAVFGERVNFRPRGGEAYDIVGIYDRAYTPAVEPVAADEAGIITTRPVLGVRDSAFLSPPRQGDRVWIYRVSALFVVNAVQPDSHGGTQLILNRVSA